MEDRFETLSPGLSSPATRAAAVVPSDEAALPFRPRAIYVGGAGNLVLRALDGTTTEWKNVPAGSLLPFRPTHIPATGTTATGILALD